MRSLLRVAGGRLLLLALALAPGLAAQDRRDVLGVVVDAASGAPVADVLVTIQGTGLQSVTDPYGRFQVGDVPVGSVQLVLRHIAYGEHARPLEVGAEGSLEFRIRISSRAIELAPVVVEVASDFERARRASGNATHVVERATIDALARSGASLHDVLSSQVPSLRAIGSCLEYRLQLYTSPDPTADEANTLQRYGIACRDITVYVDGIPSFEGSRALELISPNEVERLQVLSPSDAGVRYLDAERGIILVETRRGSGGTQPGVKVTGFAWKEPEPYRLWRVLALSGAVNAAVAGLTSTTFLDCDGNDERRVGARALRCDATFGTGAAGTTSILSGLITRRAGRTSYTEGRMLPSFLIGAATASLGYMLHIHGAKADSDLASAAGGVVLAAGVPLSLTLSDRVFRVLR